MNSIFQPATFEDMSHLGKKWIWILLAGVVYLALGVFAFFMPVSSSVGLTFALAALLLVGGLVDLFHAFQLRQRHGALTRFLQSLLAIIAGALMLRYPGGGMLGLALILSFYFFFSAAFQTAVAFSIRPHKGWGWTLVSAVASLVLGVYIVATFPFSAFWVPGVLLGVNLIFSGSAMIGLALAVSSHHRYVPLKPSHGMT
jgi:uncharacterized membrane protein HdeD (DUF308 family)